MINEVKQQIFQQSSEKKHLSIDAEAKSELQAAANDLKDDN